MSFNIDCNVCSCFAGNLICSTRQCLTEHSSEDERRKFTGNFPNYGNGKLNILKARITVLMENT